MLALDHLNPAQLEAVRQVQGPVLVVAGAGSGKTRVIEYRVAHLVKSGVEPSSILLLTFTRKAAREMLSRAERHDGACKDVEGGTFHSFANRMLRKYARSLGFAEGFSIIDRDDAEAAIGKCASQLGFFDRPERFPKKDTLAEVISMSFNKGMSIKGILEREYPHYVHLAEEIEQLRSAYVEYKINLNYVDYDDLLLYLRLLLQQETVGKAIANRYGYIMVDEFQDTNKVQGEIVQLLAKDHGNVMVVGDDAQSIYGFRGASHENIMAFPELFPGCKMIKLEENYRSTQAILEVGNAVMGDMKSKFYKRLVSARGQSGEKPSLTFFRDDSEEADWIAEGIKGARDEGTPLSQQAVLYRSTRSSIVLQLALRNRGIPYLVVGGQSFQKAAHVKDLVAHLRVLQNPRDELAWMRLLELIEGIGPKTAERITTAITARSPARLFPEDMPLIQIACKVIADVAGEGLWRLEGLMELSTLLEKASIPTLAVADKYDLILLYYEPILKRKFDNWHRRLDDLHTLGEVAARYRSLEQLITDFTLEPFEQSAYARQAVPDEQPVTISTIHSAKGLEWKIIYLPCLMDGTLPSSFALKDEEELEEELRLLYVAVTRAKERLYLSMHHELTRQGVTRYLAQKSRFLTPTILATLSQQSPLEEPKSAGAIYDKNSLLRAVLGIDSAKGKAP